VVKQKINFVYESTFYARQIDNPNFRLTSDISYAKNLLFPFGESWKNSPYRKTKSKKIDFKFEILKFISKLLGYKEVRAYKKKQEFLL